MGKEKHGDQEAGGARRFRAVDARIDFPVLTDLHETRSNRTLSADVKTKRSRLGACQATGQVPHESSKSSDEIRLAKETR